MARSTDPIEPSSGRTAGAATSAANVTERGRRRRRRNGWLTLALAALIVAALAYAGVPRGWRVLVAPLFYVGALGVFQARART